MKALTLTQPWATLVAIGAKQIETRSWTTTYRGPLAIHAAKGLAGMGGTTSAREQEEALGDLCATEPFLTELERHYGQFFRSGMLPRAAIVATCNLVDVVHTQTMTSLPFGVSKTERAFGDYAHGRFAWILHDIAAITPVEARGRQQLWDPAWSEELELAGYQLEDAANGSPRCVRCGCTNNIACDDGCGWHTEGWGEQLPVCTSCV